MNEYIRRVVDGENLSVSEARTASTLVFEDATEAQIGALLSALRTKGETEAEVAGFAQGMYEAARHIDPDRAPLVDTCGARSGSIRRAASYIPRANPATSASVSPFARSAESSAPIGASVASSKTSVDAARASETERLSPSTTRRMYSFIPNTNVQHWVMMYKQVHQYKAVVTAVATECEKTRKRGSFMVITVTVHWYDRTRSCGRYRTELQ